MPSAPRSRYSLQPHPATPRSIVRELAVDLEHAASAQLRLRYRLTGEVSSLLLPAPAPAVRADGLWRHTCFEAFIAPAGPGEYWEYNFSPSGAWAAYQFSSYRSDMRQLAEGAPPVISVEMDAAEFTLAATLDLGWLARSRGFAALRLGIAAVIEDRAHGLSYWALQHGAEKPDFHRADSFVVALA